MYFVLDRVCILSSFFVLAESAFQTFSGSHLYTNTGRLPTPPPWPGGRGSVKCQLVESRNYNSFFFLVYYCFLASVGNYGATSKSFIFSLVDKESLAPFKSMVKHDSSSYAIYRGSTNGPTFGGHDIYIADNANQNANSYASLGAYYSIPNGVTDSSTILAGTSHFSPDEVEVFYLA